MLKGALQFIFKPALAFLLLFLAARIIFILTYTHANAESWLALIYALRLDISAVSYLLIVPLVLMFFSSKKWRNVFLKCYYLLFLNLLIVLLIANLILYRYWQSLVGIKALEYFKDFKLIFASISTTQLIFVLLCIIIICIALSRIFLKITKRVFYNELSIKTKLIFIPIMAGLLFLGIRGGWQLIPINESASYYSNKIENNDASANAAWHLMYGLRSGIMLDNPYQFFERGVSESILKISEETEIDSNVIFKTSTPNFMFFILEGLNADVMKCLGGEKGVTPFLDSLSEQGILFQNIYASGTRTDQGIVSIISGWPAVPDYSIMRYSDKNKKLPSLVRTLTKMGYSSSFYYGGDGSFSGMNSYCINAGIQNFVDISNGNFSGERNKWGYHDEYVLQKVFSDMNEGKQPFINFVMTLTNHEPFILPVQGKFEKGKEGDQYRNTANYLDKCLNDFMKKSEKASWFDNTVFVFVSDHGHALPNNKSLTQPSTHHIPLILFGKPLQLEEGKKITKTGGHHDLPKTILLALKNDDYNLFKWSKNLFSTKDKGYAYFTTSDYSTWISDSTDFVLMNSKTCQVMDEGKGNNEENKNRLKAWLQLLFEAYLNY